MDFRAIVKGQPEGRSVPALLYIYMLENFMSQNAKIQCE